MALYAKRHLIRQGIRVLTGTKAEQIYERGTQGRVAGIKTSAGNLPCEMIIMAAGIRPNTEFLNDSGYRDVQRNDSYRRSDENESG